MLENEQRSAYDEMLSEISALIKNEMRDKTEEEILEMKELRKKNFMEKQAANNSSIRFCSNYMPTKLFTYVNTCMSKMFEAKFEAIRSQVKLEKEIAGLKEIEQQQQTDEATIIIKNKAIQLLTEQVAQLEVEANSWKRKLRDAIVEFFTEIIPQTAKFLVKKLIKPGL